MSVPTRLAAFALALAATFVIGLSLGAATDTSTDAPPATTPAEPEPAHDEHAP
jgi:hypothetical protein